MTEREFTRRRQASWDAWDAWVSGRQPVGEGLPLDEVPARFRALCADLSLARHRGYSPPLLDVLHQRVLKAHQQIYGSQARRAASWLTFFGGDFPRLVRTEGTAVVMAAVLLFTPLATQIWVLQRAPNAIYLVLPPEQVGQMEAMYAPDAPHLGRPRQATTEWMMWGLYVANNVRIDFQCFAGGLAFGVGTVFFLLYNGLIIGGIAGHLTRIGYGETFWGFVAGHSALELIGATLSGAAGLIVGAALISPGRRSRAAALVARGAVAVRLLYGAAVMTLLAAFVEAFWSPQRGIPVTFKYAVGLAMWALLLGYLLLTGRTRHAR